MIILSLILQKLLLVLLLLQFNFLFKVKSITHSHLFSQFVFGRGLYYSNWIFVYLRSILDSQCFFLLKTLFEWMLLVLQTIFARKYNQWSRMVHILFRSRVFTIYSQLFFLLDFCPRIKAFYVHALLLQFWKLFSFCFLYLFIILGLDARFLRVLIILKIKVFLNLLVWFLVLERIVITNFS